MGPNSVTVRSKAWLFGRSFAGIMGLNPDVGMDIICCHGEVFASR